MDKNMDIKEIQSVALEIYKEVDRICQKNGLKLFLTGGSVLGAVRHHGFIPWDDDMDVALPREDYEIFAKAAPGELPKHLKLVWMKRPNHYRVMDTRYEIELNEIYAQHINEGDKAYIAIDVQPFDGAAINNGYFWHCFAVFFYRVAYKMCKPEKIYVNSERKKWEAILIKLLKKISFVFANEEKMQTKYNNLMKKYDYKKCKYIADFVGKYKFRDVYPKSWWEPGEIVKFEDVEVRIPSEYDKYLTQIYGNYMVIPDEKERVIHRTE